MAALGLLNAAQLIALSYLPIFFNFFLIPTAVPHGVIYAPYRSVDIIYDLATLMTTLGFTFEYLFNLAIGAVAKKGIFPMT